MKETTYTKARENLAGILDQVVDDREVIVIKRRGNRNVALISEADLSSLLETAYVLRSPKNAMRLVEALEWAKSNEGQPITPISAEEAIANLKQELGVDKEEGSETTAD